MAKKNTPVSVTRNLTGKVKDLYTINNKEVMGSPFSSAQNLGKGIETKIVGDFMTVTTMFVSGIIIFVLAVIFFQFILIIINKSAYLTPNMTYTSFFDPGGGFADPSGCPIAGGYVLFGSYNPAHETDNQGGHGSSYYWSSTGLNCYSIPQESGCHSSDPPDSNRCNSPGHAPSCKFYGFAADIFGGAVGAPVILPLVDGLSTTFNCHHQSWGGLWQPGTTVECGSTDGKVFLVMTHVVLNGNSSGSNLPSGTIVATLVDQGGNTHLHFEVQVNGAWVRPENYFCK